MKILAFAMLIFTSSLAFTSQATTVSGGVIYFTGVVSVPASAALVDRSPGPVSSGHSSQVNTLESARRMLFSDLLDYYATYAPKNAKVVSATYN
ncbi:hypothetical protein ISP15_02070 [Dyella jejuensis]|uniref:Uncharacterized protein n=1 Tax=Dyella jejuensis TaxID=1432009 RepID=A0ABW8JF47_9GAMM